MTDKRIKEPCPFCNEPADRIQITHVGLYTRIACTNCGAKFDGNYSKQDLIDKWNRRWR